MFIAYNLANHFRHRFLGNPIQYTRENLLHIAFGRKSWHF